MPRRRSSGGPPVTVGAPVNRRRTTMNPAIIGRSPFGQRAAIDGFCLGWIWKLTFNFHMFITIIVINYWPRVTVAVVFFFFFSTSREFLLLQQNLAIASLWNFLSIFMTSIQECSVKFEWPCGWPWCMTLTFQYFCILSHNSVSAGQNISKFLLSVA